MDNSQIITSGSMAAQAAHRWHIQFRLKRAHNQWYDQEKKEIYDRLVALGPNPQPSQVDAVIGNRAWTMPPSCSECGDPEPSYVVMVGNLADDQCYLCPVCIRNLAALAGIRS